MDLASIRRASSAAQAYLQMSDPNLVITGEISSRSMQAYNNANPMIRQQCDNMVTIFGFRSLDDLYQQSVKYKNGGFGSTAPIWETKVVPAVIRACQPLGVNPVNLIAQMALESAWGKKVPLKGGQNSYNYAGIKVKAAQGVPGFEAVTGTVALTREVIGGFDKHVKDAFASFDSPDDFARCYVGYLTKSKSSYRYPGIANNPGLDPFTFGSIMQRGGYATDPNYASFFARIALTVRRKFAIN